MKYAKMKELLLAFARILQSLLTVSYLGAYRHCTFEPIQEIERNQEEHLRDELMKALIYFRYTKNEELSFVTKAVRQRFFQFVDFSSQRKLSDTTRKGYLVCSGGHRRLFVAYHRHDRVGC
jgi:hypothetical protein